MLLAHCCNADDHCCRHEPGTLSQTRQFGDLISCTQAVQQRSRKGHVQFAPPPVQSSNEPGDRLL